MLSGICPAGILVPQDIDPKPGRPRVDSRIHEPTNRANAEDRYTLARPEDDTALGKARSGLRNLVGHRFDVSNLEVCGGNNSASTP
jgi:hypothetical protein